MIALYCNRLKESSFFTKFIVLAYKGQGLGRKIIETLENNEYYKRTDRIEVPASISAVGFYNGMELEDGSYEISNIYNS